MKKKIDCLWLFLAATSLRTLISPHNCIGKAMCEVTIVSVCVHVGEISDRFYEWNPPHICTHTTKGLTYQCRYHKQKMRTQTVKMMSCPFTLFVPLCNTCVCTPVLVVPCKSTKQQREYYWTISCVRELLLLLCIEIGNLFFILLQKIFNGIFYSIETTFWVLKINKGYQSKIKLCSWCVMISADWPSSNWMGL